MVFSIFKKSAEKMPERKAARPKPLTPAPEEVKPAGTVPEAPAALAEPEPEGRRELPPLEFSDSQFDFTESSVMAIEVDHDIDPVQADVEQAAVLFANGQDSAARAVLEAAARGHEGARAERLWRMLLDLVQVLGDRTAFDRLGEEFAHACETSPPTWRAVIDKMPTPAAAPLQAAVTLQGVAAGTDAPEFMPLKAALKKPEGQRIDLGKLAGCDDAAAAVLCNLLKEARKKGLTVLPEGVEALAGRLEKRLVAGQAEAADAWLLLLELYQHLGRQEVFEEKAVDYAVTFEVSPPSWEPVKPAPAARPAITAPLLAPAADIHFLAGELKNCRFDDLKAFLELQDRPVLDFTHVKRLDFFSAGLLRNIVEPYKRKGKEIIIRNPHHLVAELMGIVDIPAVARIVVPKY